MITVIIIHHNLKLVNDFMLNTSHIHKVFTKKAQKLIIQLLCFTFLEINISSYAILFLVTSFQMYISLTLLQMNIA